MKILEGKDFFDNEAVFEKYIQHRKKSQNPNEIIEKPIVLDLMKEVTGHVLDLGCGYGDLAEILITRRVTHYTGIDSAEKMIQLGKSRYTDSKIELIHADIENWEFEVESYDWVISRLVLHYVENLEALLEKIHTSLKRNGQFLFSVEHPVLTSSIDQSSGKKSDWKVDNYFRIGSREQDWLGGSVSKYHRTIEEYWRLLKIAGFEVQEVKEGCPDKKYFQSVEEYDRRCRIPLFLIIKAVKK